jgi:hypothetical protein
MAAACLFEWFSLQQAQLSVAMVEAYHTRSSLSGLYTYTDNSTPTPPKLGPAATTIVTAGYLLSPGLPR